MKNRTTTHILTAAGTIILAVALLNPLGLWMPDMVVMLLLALLFAIFCVYAVFISREEAGDEREAQMRTSAGHAAFLAGAAVLVLAIVVQELHHALDPWVPVALILMIVAKLGVHTWDDFRLRASVDKSM